MFCPPNAHLSFCLRSMSRREITSGSQGQQYSPSSWSPVFMHIVPKNVVPYSINCLSMWIINKYDYAIIHSMFLLSHSCTLPTMGHRALLCIIGIIINTCKHRLGHSITIFTGYFRAKEKLLIIQFSTLVFNKYCHKNTFSIFNQQMHIVLEVCELCKKSDPHAPWSLLWSLSSQSIHYIYTWQLMTPVTGQDRRM